MSFMIHIQSFKDGECYPFPREVFDKAFSSYPHVIKHDPYLWIVDFPGAKNVDIYVDDTPELLGFSVDRPPLSPFFWDAIISILKQTPSLLYWPGTGCIIAGPEVRRHIPQDFIDGQGEPTVTTDRNVILDTIKRG